MHFIILKNLILILLQIFKIVSILKKSLNNHYLCGLWQNPNQITDKRHDPFTCFLYICIYISIAENLLVQP